MTNFLSTNLSKHEVRESPPYSIQAELQAIPSSSRRLMQIRFSIVGCRAFVWLCNRVMCVYVACLCRSEEHTSELQSLMRISYAVFCLKKKKERNNQLQTTTQLAHTPATLLLLRQLCTILYNYDQQ